MQKSITVCVTGAAGQIAYSFIPMLLSGQVFGDVPIELRLLDIPPMEQVLKGVEMEIVDCAYSLLRSIETGSDPRQLFVGADLVVFLGGFPRKPGMERKDLLQTNAKIFKQQGEALNEVAKETVKCVVVANPANTNCWILSQCAPRIPKHSFTCLTRLDQNRAVAQIGAHLKVSVNDIKNVIIWGNHSTTQYPSVEHATINQQPIKLNDEFIEQFITKVQKRGAEVMQARNNSSVFSAANAVKGIISYYIDHIKDWCYGRVDTLLSMGVIGNGAYGVPEGLCFSYPLKCIGEYKYLIDGHLELSEYSKQKIAVTVAELVEEQQESGI